MANWERKSQYLLTEIVKYDSYIESLKAGMSLRLKKRGEKVLEKALEKVNPEDAAATGKQRWKGYPEEETIPEGEEPPPTPNALSVQHPDGRGKNGDSRSSSRHRRETAEA